MKKILFIIMLLTVSLFGTINKLYIYANSSPDKIELKWFLKNYSSNYTFKLYRAKKGKKLKLIAAIKPTSISDLKKAGYNDDYIFMIYPFKDIKNRSEAISILKIMPKISTFRAIRAMQENSFAKNLGHYFIDKLVDKNSIYLYKIEAYEENKKILSKMIIATTKPYKKGKDILWVRAFSKNNGIALSWDTQSAFAFYNIYKKAKGEKRYKKINKIPLYIERDYSKKAKYLFLDKDIKEGIFASYYITKIDMFANEGKPSKKVSVKYTKKILIRRVKKLFANAKKNRVILRWSKVNNALGYNVYKGVSYQGKYKKINKKPIKKIYFLDENYKEGKAIYYFVTALNLKGESSPSNIVMAFYKDTTPPKKVTNLKAKTKPGKVILSWKKNTDKDLLGYNVYVTMNIDKKEWSLVNKHFIKNNFFIHNLPKTLSRYPYYYRVSAVDTSLNESLLSKIVKVQLPDTTPPTQPTLKKYRVYSHKIILEWTKSTVYDFDYYNIYKKKGGKWIKLNKTPLEKSYFEDNYPNTSKNFYAITTVDKNNNESPIKRNFTIFLKDLTPPTIKNIIIKKTAKGVYISFDCDDKDFAGFEVYRSSGKILKYFNISNFIKNKKSFLDKNIAKNAHYFYRIFIYDKNGNLSKSKVLEIKIKNNKI